MAWRAAFSLTTLKGQLDATYPGWTFLGFIGDQSHTSASDHSPNAQNVVCALDIGPGGGLNIHTLADNIVAKPHPNLKYIISNRRIANWQNGFKWQAYSGSDPHDTHIHVSVGRGPDGQSAQPYDDKTNWNIGGTTMPTKQEIKHYFNLLVNRDPRPDEYDFYVGKPWTAVVNETTRHYIAVKQEEVNKLKKQLDAQGTVLAPGKYVVKTEGQ